MTRRRVFNIATAVSLVLLIADLGVVIRGSYYADQYRRLSMGMDGDGRWSTQWVLHTSGDGFLIYYEKLTQPWGTASNGAKAVPPVLVDSSRLEHFAARDDDISPFRFRFPPASLHDLGVVEFASTSYQAGHGTTHDTLVIVRQWAILLPLLILPLLMIVKIERARARRRIGKCRKCGYDLKGNASGVCPECGRLIAVG